MTNMDAATNRVQGMHGGDGALEFDGANERADCGNRSSLDMTNRITIAGWIKLSQLKSYNVVLAKGAGLTTNYALRVRDTGILDFFLYDTAGAFHGVVDMATDNLITTNVWTHVVGTYNGSIFKVYVNGIEDTHTTTWSGDIVTTAANLLVGCRKPQYLRGSISGASIHNRTLLAEQVARLHREPYCMIWTPGE